MKNNPVYNKIFPVIYKLNRKYKYIDSIKTSHDIVAYLMIQMNYMCAKRMVSFKTGIYRSAKVNNNIDIPDNVDEGLKKFLKMWYSFGGNYCTMKI